jgi:hypothetical protein
MNKIREFFLANKKLITPFVMGFAGALIALPLVFALTSDKASLSDGNEVLAQGAESCVDSDAKKAAKGKVSSSNVASSAPTVNKTVKHTTVKTVTNTTAKVDTTVNDVVDVNDNNVLNNNLNNNDVLSENNILNNTDISVLDNSLNNNNTNLLSNLVNGVASNIGL